MLVRTSRILLVAGVAVLAWGEWVNWRSSRRLVGSVTGASEVVVVLGFGNPAPSANALNRWRVRAGLRSCDPRLDTRMIFCGGAVRGSRPEAELMAAYARERGWSGPVALDTASRSTWENVENAIALMGTADRIKIVSNPLHAEQARRYLAVMRPDLAARLVRGAEYRFGEWTLVKPLFAVLGYRQRGRAPVSPAR
ncbi:YdcF family protein [Nocardia sienata]|uniref:YdcF family protein n=1 Tax=Nocardia sienata TaxID=248552 RepID=UPI0007A37C47|nr:YdcF family protein [Nocardia sienata]